jgi:hypothetical protein
MTTNKALSVNRKLNAVVCEEIVLLIFFDKASLRFATIQRAF